METESRDRPVSGANVREASALEEAGRGQDTVASLTVSNQPDTLISRSDRTLTNASIHTPSSWISTVTDYDVSDRVPQPPAAGNAEGEEEGAGEHNTLLQNQQPQPVIYRRNRLYVWLCIYGVVLTILVLAAFVVVALALVPRPNNAVSPPYATNNDTVQLKFNLANVWLKRAVLTVTNDCVGLLISIPGSSCSRVMETHSVQYRYDTPLEDFIYLLPGSTIVFDVPPEVPNDTHIWIFMDRDVAYDFLDNPENFICTRAPSGAYCYNAREHTGVFSYNVTRASHYFLSFTPHRQNITWYFEKRVYDYMALLQYQVGVLAPTAAVKFREPFCPTSFEDSCTLLHIDDSTCAESDQFGNLSAEVTRREDILLYPSIIFSLALIALAMTATVHCLCVRGRQRGPMEDTTCRDQA